MAVSFEKMGGLVPAVVQDAVTRRVLMLGFMNEEALKTTRDRGLVTFWSRSRETLWTKGETSGNYLEVRDIIEDCDNDTFLCVVSTGRCYNRKDIRVSTAGFAQFLYLRKHPGTRVPSGGSIQYFFSRG